MWDLIVSVPDHCLSFYLTHLHFLLTSCMHYNVTFSNRTRKLIKHHKRIGYNPYIMRQNAYLAVNPITVDSYALLVDCKAVVRASDSK